MRPAVGIGTIKFAVAKRWGLCRAAIADGYRLIDSSTNYDNEGIVGKGVAGSGVPVLEVLYHLKITREKYHG